MIRLRFEQDDLKAAANFRKHGVHFTEAASAFLDEKAIGWYDKEHSEWPDDRFVHIGLSSKRRLLFIVHNEADELIRIISARPATSAERDLYEKG